MAENSSNHINYILAIEQKHQDYLGNIRHWSNLKIASDEGMIWIKDLTNKQIESIEIRSIPYKQIYNIKENKLFPLGSNLPLLKAPSLLWTPIEIGLPVKLPNPNHNYFGVQETIAVNLVLSDKEYETYAIITSASLLAPYIETAPAVRLKNLTWSILEQGKILILGKPIIPIKGDTYWCVNNFLLPTGYNFESDFLAGVISAKINQQNKWIVWNSDSTYFEIEKNVFIPLTISSFRKSTSLLQS